MLPFPDDYYTVNDPSTETGRRIDFQTDATPANASDVHMDAAPYNAERRLQPRAGDRRPGPRARHAGGARGDRRRSPSATSAGTRKRARRSSSSTRRPASAGRSGSRSTRTRHRRRDGGADPPGGELRLRPPLHRRDAQPQGRRRRHARRSRGLPLLPRRPAVERVRRSTTSATASTASSTRCRDADVKRSRPLPRLGLHGR